MKQNKNFNELQWTKIHRPGNRFDIHCITELAGYGFLIFELTKKSIRSVYTQTVLGPVWLIIQPLLTSIVFVSVFQKVIGIPVQGRSSFVFYSTGVVLWGHFAKSVNAVSNVFISNRNIFGKIYFPRLAVPVAEIVANLFKFGLQFSVLLVIYILLFKKNFAAISLVSVLCFSGSLVQVTLFAAGVGLISASVTTVFRDMSIMITYGINLLFYATPILYPVNRIPDSIWRFLKFNPMIPAVDIFRFPFNGTLLVSCDVIISGAVISILFCLAGLILFFIAQRSCIDKI